MCRKETCYRREFARALAGRTAQACQRRRKSQSTQDANSLPIQKESQSSIFPHCWKANSTASSIAASADSIVFPCPTARRAGFRLQSVFALVAAHSRFQENNAGNGK